MAIGRMGMTLDDVRRLTFAEFEAIVKEWNREREREYQDSWERMRMQATISIQPHIKKRMSPQSLLPFPWERKIQNVVSEQPTISKKKRLERFKTRMEKRRGIS